MGQYHQFMNFDKKEICSPHGLSKLMEWSYQKNDYLLSVEQLLKSSWKNDRVLVIGDYVTDFYNDDRYKKIFDDIRKANSNYNESNIYFYQYKEVSASTTPTTLPTRYIYNHEKKQYIDLKIEAIQGFFYDKKENTLYGQNIHPLPLLLSVSNGAGGGDYYSVNQYYVGSWATTSSKIELSDIKLDLNYEEIGLLFDETNSKKSNPERIVDYLSKEFKNNIDKIDNLKFDESLFLANDEIELIKEQSKDIISITTENLKEDIEIERDI